MTCGWICAACYRLCVRMRVLKRRGRERDVEIFGFQDVFFLSICGFDKIRFSW
jgi:hypothetical protein